MDTFGDSYGFRAGIDVIERKVSFCRRGVRALYHTMGPIKQSELNYQVIAVLAHLLGRRGIRAPDI